MFAPHVDEAQGCVVDAEFPIDVGNEIRQRLMHTGQILAGESPLDVAIGAHAEEYRVEFRGDVFEGDVAADIDIQAKFDAHVLHDLAALLDDVFFELEWRDAEGQQAADLRVAVEDHRRHAVAGQDVGAGESRRPGADDGNAFAGPHHIRHVGLPTLLEGLVGDVLLDSTDAHGADAVVQGARAFAQAVLGADSAAHFGQ